MSTDSTELTFIRCPSCRSLVPAVSPRCRMCGAVLDGNKSEASGGADSNTASKKATSRVRQQTVAVSDNDIKAAKEAFKQPENKDPYGFETQLNEIIEDDPFESASTREFSSDSLTEEPELKTKAEEFDDFSSTEEELHDDHSQEEQDQNTDFGDPLGAFIEEVPVEESLSETKPTDRNGNGYHSESAHEEAAQEESALDELPEPTPVAQTKRVSSIPLQQGEQRARVVIESGHRKGSAAKTGLSFSKNRTATVVKTALTAEEVKVSEPTKSFSVAAPQSEIAEEPVSHQVSPAVAQRSAPEISSNAVKSSEAASKGRLYGWLVSYSDPRGIANELRDGKFFVSRSSLKGTDLILDDESISTPHALVGVNVNDGLMIQDLMSDRGVFVRRRTADTYQRVLESTKIEHGDWIRFGDVEFLVAIISVSSGR